MGLFDYRSAPRRAGRDWICPQSNRDLLASGFSTAEAATKVRRTFLPVKFVRKLPFVFTRRKARAIRILAREH